MLQEGDSLTSTDEVEFEAWPGPAQSVASGRTEGSGVLEIVGPDMM